MCKKKKNNNNELFNNFYNIFNNSVHVYRVWRKPPISIAACLYSFQRIQYMNCVCEILRNCHFTLIRFMWTERNIHSCWFECFSFIFLSAFMCTNISGQFENINCELLKVYQWEQQQQKSKNEKKQLMKCISYLSVNQLLFCANKIESKDNK